MYLWIQPESASCPTWRSTRFHFQLLISSSSRLPWPRFPPPASLTRKLLPDFYSRTSAFYRTRPGTCQKQSSILLHLLAICLKKIPQRFLFVLKIFQFAFRIAVAREAQQVAMEQELLENLPLLFKNRPEQVSMALECKGKGGQPCQGAANITVTVRPVAA